MQPPTVREVITMLRQDGWILTHTRGDHRQFEKGSLKVTVLGKPGDHLRKGTWASIKRQAGW